MLLEILRNPPTAIAYAMLETLKQRFPQDSILETDDPRFDWDLFASHHELAVEPVTGFLEQMVHYGPRKGRPMSRHLIHGFFQVQWEGHTLRIMQILKKTDCGPETHCWILAENESAARAFFATVCQWREPIHQEIYVYQEGTWEIDAELFESIQIAQLDNLILPPGLKESILDDAATFFESRERYKSLKIAWKRGVILIGPPGNGKTHLIQGLINNLKKPCLYLKSLKARYQNEDRSIREVFDKARLLAPCILVMEDLDAIIDDGNRSFFLNELDGFRKNDGIFVIATTNHPERLDPAIVDRPSRFDRKYHFHLPAFAERKAYLRWWNENMEPALHLSEPGIEKVSLLTEGFSFAYLKELGLSSIMAWFHNNQIGMDETMAAQAVVLRGQMSSHPA